VGTGLAGKRVVVTGGSGGTGQAVTVAGGVAGRVIDE
jgi:hypothetical protein